jgi:stage II sporulation protein D
LAVRHGWLEPGETLRALQVAERTPHGRVARLAFVGRSTHEVSGLEFFRASGKDFGWNKVKSTAFVIQDAMDGWRLDGRGLGHGVGFCQWGAQGLARRGAAFREILLHYFPGARIVGPEMKT